MWELDPVDRGFLNLITKGYTSSYAIWLFLKKESKEADKSSIKVMAYNNVNRRILILANAGLLEESSLDNRFNLHGRKDYKLSMKGLEHLIPHILTHPEEAQNIVEYMDNFRMDKETFGKLLIDRMRSMLQALTIFERCARIPLTPVLESLEFEEEAKRVKEIFSEGFRFREHKEE